MKSDLEMHILVVFGLIANTISRIIGTIVSMDMYSKTRERRHLLQVLGWIALSVSGFLPFGIILTEDLFIVNLFRLSSIIFIDIGVYLLISGLSMYFVSYPRNMVVGGFITTIVAPMLAFILFDGYIAISISVFIQFLIMLAFLILVYSNLNEIKNILQYSYGMIVFLTMFLIFYIVVYVYVIAFVPDYNYGLYTSTDSIAIMAYYTAAIMVTLLGLLVFLHLEQGIYLKKKNLLRDAYSHKIGNILQIIMGAGSTIKAYSNANEVNENTDLILERTEEAGELIKKIREM